MRVNWDNIDEGSTYETLPDGEYPVAVTDVVTKQTKGGDEYWRLELTVTSGQHSGAIVQDSLFFTEKGWKRVKLVCSRLGLDTTGDKDFTTHDLIGKKAIVDVTTEEREYNGKKIRDNKIPFAGYKSIGNGSTPAIDAMDKMDDLPF